VYRLAIQAGAESRIDRLDAEGHRRSWGLAAVADAACLYGGDRLPERAQILRRQVVWHGTPPIGCSLYVLIQRALWTRVKRDLSRSGR
jgi:hypothetical protein